MKHLKSYKLLFEELNPDIGIENSENTINMLNTLLSNHFVLFMKIWNFHWIMVSKAFGPYHEFFGKLYTEYFDSIDKIAERVRMLGGKPIGTLKGYLEKANLIEFDGEDTPSIKDMVKMVLVDYESIIKDIRKILGDENLDNGTSKFMEDLIEAYEKDAWMLRSHLKEE